MFIEQHRLESNPFAPDRARPFFASHSVRYASLKVAQLLEQQIQCLFLSGAVRVGKTTMVKRQLYGASNVEICWIKPGTDNVHAFLSQLVSVLGPGEVEGSASELKNILEVYLKFQAARARQSLIVADDLEQFPNDVLREIEELSQLKNRQRPIVQFILVTRNEDLVGNLVSEYDGGYLARAVHHRLMGFNLEETGAYVRSALKGAGCTWSDELISDEVVTDILGFTNGVVGDVDALCCAVLEELAVRSASSVRQPRVTRALLKEIGAGLHLRYDPTAWKKQPEETLLPGAVELKDSSELKIEAARLLVSSGGHTVAEISLNKPRMILGRDTSCDISVNSSFVSRYQNLFMETATGWMLIDLNSTNGCFVNGRKVSEHRLHDGDLISIGHHQIRFTNPNCGERENSVNATQEDNAAEAQVTTVVPALRIAK